LHPREQARPLLLGHLEPELLDLDPDRIEAALLAEHDRTLGADELGGVRLDRRRIVELRGDGARLTPEQGLAGERLPRRETVAGELLHALGGFANPIEAEARLDAVEGTEGERDLAEIGVPGALPPPFDGAGVHVAA